MTRLKWRLRGATMWPAFAVCLVIEGVMFGALPFSGDGPGNLVGSLLLAAGLNLVVVAALAPLGGMVLRRRRPDLPRPIATDVVGTVLLGVAFFGFLAAGLVNRSAVERDERALAASVAATSRYVHAEAPELVPYLEATDAVRLEVGVYRTCVPSDERPLCLFVDTRGDPPAVTRDPNQTPNYRG